MSFVSVHAQEIAYRVSWGAPNGHYFDVEMQFENPEDGPVSVRIPAWRPGRYIIQNYAKNIVGFQATDGEGSELNFRRTDKGTWEVDAEPGAQVIVKYSVYSRQLDAGSSYLDDQEAYINPITILMYIPGRELLPVSFAVSKPADWKAATQLVFDTTRDLYISENYHELVDAPIIISPTLDIRSFEYGGATFEVAIQGKHQLDLDKLLADLQKVAEVQTNLMGVIPFDRYVFLYHIVDKKFGHGVEHKNSTSIVLGPADNPNLLARVLSVSAHELFHAWNVERIRPEEIYYPDYSSEQYTTTMWIYEGITSYFTSVSLVRAGLLSEDAFLKRLSGSIKSFETSYGKDITSIAMSSWDSWTRSKDPPPHIYYSFYTAGEVMGLLLDMEVRGRTRNRQSLDHVMQYLYQEYAARRRGVPEDGLQRALETITSGSMQPFFDAHVFGTEQIDYDNYLYHAGYRLEKGTDPNLPSVSLGLAYGEGTGGAGLTVTSVRPESAAFAAGLDIDDTVIAIDGKRVSTGDIGGLLKSYQPGDSVEVTFFRRNELRTVNIELDGGGNETFMLTRLPNTSPLQNQTRRDWMNLAAG